MNSTVCSLFRFDPELRADGRIRTADQLITNQLL